MSKLRHPCIIGFLGISIVNNLMITMEMAAEGSLRTVLTRCAESHSFNKYRDREKVFRPVLGKDITYRIIYQVSLVTERELVYLTTHSTHFMHHPTDRITHATAFGTPVVEHWLEREIASLVTFIHPFFVFVCLFVNSFIYSLTFQPVLHD